MENKFEHWWHIWLVYYIGLHYKLSLARRALPRQVFVAGTSRWLSQAPDDLASPGMSIYFNLHPVVKAVLLQCGSQDDF